MNARIGFYRCVDSIWATVWGVDDAGAPRAMLSSLDQTVHRDIDGLLDDFGAEAAVPPVEATTPAVAELEPVEPPETAPANAFCGKCGTAYKDDTEFCTNCGAARA